MRTAFHSLPAPVFVCSGDTPLGRIPTTYRQSLRFNCSMIDDRCWVLARQCSNSPLAPSNCPVGADTLTDDSWRRLHFSRDSMKTSIWLQHSSTSSSKGAIAFGFWGAFWPLDNSNNSMCVLARWRSSSPPGILSTADVRFLMNLFISLLKSAFCSSFVPPHFDGSAKRRAYVEDSKHLIVLSGESNNSPERTMYHWIRTSLLRLLALESSSISNSSVSNPRS